MARNTRRELRGDHRNRILAASVRALRAQWRRALLRLIAEVTDLYRRHQVYTELVHIVRNNNNALNPPVFFNWARDNYIVSICLGIRRLSDVRSDSLSLGRLLREVELRPEIISRASYRALVRRKHVSAQDADYTFDLHVGRKHSHVSKNAVTAEIGRLERSDTRIRKLVNKRLAHNAPFSQMRRPPTFQEIEDSLEEFDKLLVKYEALIAGGGLSTAWSRLLNWHRVFWKAWVPDGPRAELPGYEGPQHVRMSF